MSPVHSIPVSLEGRAYEVIVGVNILSELGPRLRTLWPALHTPARGHIALDANLPASLHALATASLSRAGFAPTTHVITPSEPDKSLATVEHILAALVAARQERTEPVIALGGGIVGDVAGFAASIYRRGVPVIQCPTTLLSMVDAAVGGKTGVNLFAPPTAERPQGSLKKNMVGAFHQPSLVMCDIDTLDSLSPRLFACGLAECIKHALLAGEWGDPGLLAWMQQHLARIVLGDKELRAELVARNVAIKARVVMADEREEKTDHTGRMVLNMGHTVAHVIETLPCTPIYPHQTSPSENEKPAGLQHGEAVGLGLIAETVCAELSGITQPGTSRIVEQLLIDAGLPTRVANLPPESRLIELMFDDKKVEFGKLRFVAPTGDGGCRVLESPTQPSILTGLRSIVTLPSPSDPRPSA